MHAHMFDNTLTDATLPLRHLTSHSVVSVFVYPQLLCLFHSNRSLFGLAFSFCQTQRRLWCCQFLLAFTPAQPFGYIISPFFLLPSVTAESWKVNKADWLSLSSVCLPENGARCMLAIRNAPLHSGCLIVASCFSAVQLFTHTCTHAETKTLRLSYQQAMGSLESGGDGRKLHGKSLLINNPFSGLRAFITRLYMLQTKLFTYNLFKDPLWWTWCLCCF